MSKTTKIALALLTFFAIINLSWNVKNHFDQPVLLAEATARADREVKMLREQLGIEKKDHPGFDVSGDESLVEYLSRMSDRERTRLETIEAITGPLKNAGGADKLHQLATLAHFFDEDGDGVTAGYDQCEEPGDPLPTHDEDLDGCDDATTNVRSRAFEFYVPVDEDGHRLSDWPDPEKTSSNDDHLAYQWRVGRTDGFVPRAENFTAGNYFVGYLQCIALDPEGKPIPKDAKKFKFGDYGDCRIVNP